MRALGVPLRGSVDACVGANIAAFQKTFTELIVSG